MLASVVAFCGALRPGYSHTAQFISELGAMGTPHAALMNLAGFATTGALLAAFGGSLGAVLPRGGASLGVAALWTLFGVGMVVAGLVPCEPGCPQNEPTLHDAVSVAAFVAAIAGAALGAKRFRSIPAWRPLWRYSALCSAVGLGLLIALASSIETRWLTGLWQRLLIATLLSWCAIVGVRAFRQSGGDGSRRPVRGLAVLLLLSCALGCGEAPTPPERDHHSAQGFRADLPSGWTLLDGARLRENAGLFEEILGDDVFTRMDPQVLATLRADLEAGNIEFYYPEGGAGPDFADNVSVRRSPGRVPRPSELAAVCAGLGRGLSEGLGRSVSVHRCERRQVGPHRVLYLEADGVLPGSLLLQYQLRHSRGTLLVVSATCHAESAAALRPQLEAFVASLLFESPPLPEPLEWLLERFGLG